ncbi:MAG: glycosyltransferase family 4 protein [Burkholderiaceae bacterium]
MFRIALVSEHASPLTTLGGVDSGGQNVYVAKVAQTLAAAGCGVDVYTRRDGSTLPEIVDWAPRLRVIHLEAGPAEPIPKEFLLAHMPAFAHELCRHIQLQRSRYAVLHANFFMSGWATLQAARRFDLPMVITFHALGRVRRLHQGDSDGFPDLRFDIEDELVRCADRVIAECPQDLADLIEHHAADSDRVDVVPCGVDPQELQPIERSEARRRLGLPQSEFIVLQLGRMVPRKGVDNVIRGLAELAARHELQRNGAGDGDAGGALRLIVAGGDAAAPEVMRCGEIRRLAGIAETLGIADRVQFFGQCERDRLALLYSAADVFVTTPWYEPFGITPLEAMACARPVIGASVGGIRSTVIDGLTGFLIPPNDPSALADRLTRLQADPAMSRRFGQAGRARVLAQYTWSDVTRRLCHTYLRVAAAARNRQRRQAAVAGSMHRRSSHAQPIGIA